MILMLPNTTHADAPIFGGFSFLHPVQIFALTWVIIEQSFELVKGFGANI